MSITVTNNSSSSDYYDLLVRVQALEEQMLLTYNSSSFIPATAIALGRVTNEELDTLRDINTTETVQHQLDTLSDAIAANPTFNDNSTISEAEYLTLNGIDTTKTIQAQFNGVQNQISALSSKDTSLQNQINALSSSSGSTSVPIGTILMWTDETPPSGFLLCQGQKLTSASYPLLYGVIGQTYLPENVSSNSHAISTGTEFYLPDLRGVFVRGVGTNSSGGIVANGRSLGRFQDQSVMEHKHRYARPRVVNQLATSGGSGATVWDNSVHEYTDNSEDVPYLTNETYWFNGVELPNETRPTNISLHYIIKF